MGGLLRGPEAWGSGGGALSAQKFYIFLTKNYSILGLFCEKLMLLKCGIEIGSAKT